MRYLTHAFDGSAETIVDIPSGVLTSAETMCALLLLTASTTSLLRFSSSVQDDDDDDDNVVDVILAKRFASSS